MSKQTLMRRAHAFDALDRLWADTRFTGRDGEDVRALITVFLMQLARGEKVTWRSLYEQATAGQYRPVIDYWYRGIVRADLPRYRHDDSKPLRCPVPKTRGKNAGEPCGRSYSVASRVTDLETGEWVLTGWCRAHEDHARIARAREQSLTNVPEPLPNAGGLLPSYLPTYDWRLMYQRVDERWKEPYVGIVADEWPERAQVETPPVSKVAFTALDGGGEQTEIHVPLPPLRLVKG